MKPVNPFVTISSLALLLGLPAITSAQETAKKLHDSKCLACHSTHVYTRSDRKVTSFNALAQRVNMCVKGGARADWNNKQINSVTDYLNRHFYKFKTGQ